MCLLFLLALLAPRVAFALMWIFGNSVDRAFGSFFWPLLLLIFLPWTGIMYTLLWTSGNSVEGAEWIVVAAAVALDLMQASARAAKKRFSSGYGY